MLRQIQVLSAAAVLVALECLAGTARAAEEPRPGAEGFAGTWALSASRDNVDVSGLETPSGASGAGVAGGFDLPLEVMTDARRLVVTDDGTTLRVTYPSGRKRTFVTDGVVRRLDDGDGPADVTARRKGLSVTVASDWPRGYKLRETWEVRANPRRLVVTGRSRGRSSQSYVRTYQAAPPGEVVPTPPAAAATPSPEAAGGAAEPSPPLVDRLSECSVRAPRNAASEELARLAKVTQEQASRTAVASLAPAKASDVISSDVEAFEGCVVWPFTLRVAGKRGVQEVFVDAGDGKVVRSEFVPTGAPANPPEAP